MSVTVQQVAEAAKVSRSTANMILTGRHANYAEKTRKRVLDAAKELAYQPNITAQSLKHGRSYLIGAVLSSINSTYMAEFLAGLQTTVAQHRCAPTLFVADSPQDELNAFKLLADRRIDGLIVNPTHQTSDEASLLEIRRLREAKVPMVEVFGQMVGPDVPSVITDAYVVGRSATQKLIDQGCRRPALISHEAFNESTVRTCKNWFALDLFRGYNDAVVDAGVEPCIEAYSSDQLISHAPRLARQLLSQRQPDGVVTFSLSMCREIITAINADPDLAPEYFTIASIWEYLKYYPFCRNKASIHLAIREAAEQATEQLFNQINGQLAQDLSLDSRIELIQPVTDI